MVSNSNPNKWLIASPQSGPYNSVAVSRGNGVNLFMPIYEFECQKCKAHMEVLQKVSAKPPSKCAKCGGRLERVASAPAIQFKGSGWYVTDYAAKATKSDKSESESTTGNDKSTAAGDDKKADKKTKESSPANKTPEKASPPKAPSGD